MRKSVLVLIFITLVSSVFAQKKKKNDKAEPAKQEVATQPLPVKTQPAPKKDSVPSINPLIRHYAIKYQIAMQWNDPEMAKDALYDLIIENQGNDSLIYELAYYYYQNQQFPSSGLLSQTLLRRNPKRAAAFANPPFG